MSSLSESLRLDTPKLPGVLVSEVVAPASLNGVVS